MKTQRNLFYLAAIVLLCWTVRPAWGVSKEMIELQTQVQGVQDQMARMQQSFDERMGIMKNLLDQNTDSMNKLAASIAGLQSTLQRQQTDSGAHVDTLSGQVQALNDSLDELKARLAKVSKQLEEMQAAQQNLAAQPAPGAASAGPLAAPPSQAPPPDVLYNNALRDYNSANNDLAAQEFADYLKFYPNTDLAGNAYFYLAEVAYRQANYQVAIKNYDQVIQAFPDGNKVAAAELKKGFSLIELGQKDEGISTLRHLVARYPRSNEALQAKERLRKLGVANTASAPRRAEP